MILFEHLKKIYLENNGSPPEASPAICLICSHRLRREQFTSLYDLIEISCPGCTYTAWQCGAHRSVSRDTARYRQEQHELLAEQYLNEMRTLSAGYAGKPDLLFKLAHWFHSNRKILIKIDFALAIRFEIKNYPLSASELRELYHAIL